MSTVEQTKRRGRKPSNDGRTGRLTMRVKPDDKARWEQLAAEAGVTLSGWIEQHLNVARK